VPPTGLPVVQDRPLRVYVMAAPRRAEERKVKDFVESLSETLAIDATRRFQLTTSMDVPIGVDIGQWRVERCVEADIRVVLVSARLLNGGDPERDAAFADSAKIVATALGRIDEQSELAGLHLHDILNRQLPLAMLERESQRSTYASCVVDEVRRLADRLERRGWDAPDQRASPDVFVLDDEAMTRLTRTTLGTAVVDGANHYVDPRAQVTALSESMLARRADRSNARDSVPAVDHLVAWALDPKGPSHCALLGDVGMGKTTTTKLLTQRLLEMRETDPAAPLPLLFDLRDLRPSDIAQDITLTRILDSLLSTSQGTAGRPQVADVLDRIRLGGCLVIFDGLDEVLVHLSAADQQAFTRQLWRATEGRTTGRTSKLILSPHALLPDDPGRDYALHGPGQGWAPSQ
jgi:hypothetical protein